MNRPLALCLSVTCAVFLSSAAHAQPYTIERKLKPGARMKVDERRVSQYEYLYKGGNGATVGAAEVTELVRRYTDEVKTEKPEVILRDFEVSTRAKGKPKSNPEAVRTSLHGRRILVAGIHWQPDPQTPFKISEPDSNALKLERLPAAFLPPQKVVKAKASWKIASKPLAQALLGDLIPVGDKDCWAKVTLQKVKRVEGREIATMKVKCKIHFPRRDQFPEIDMQLKGEFKWALEEGALVEAHLEGPTNFVMGGKDNETVEAEGTLAWRYEAKFLESRKAPGKAARASGEPPPPGTFHLECSLNDQHRYKLDQIKRCMLCGKVLDKNRRCPDDDPWVMQYCPQDGAPLKPGKPGQ